MKTTQEMNDQVMNDLDTLGLRIDCGDVESLTVETERLHIGKQPL